MNNKHVIDCKNKETNYYSFLFKIFYIFVKNDEIN